MSVVDIGNQPLPTHRHNQSKKQLCLDERIYISPLQ